MGPYTVVPVKGAYQIVETLPDGRRRCRMRTRDATLANVRCARLNEAAARRKLRGPSQPLLADVMKELLK